MEKIVLASGSPRRKELLARTGVVFSVVVSNGEEKTNLTDPVETVEKLSQDKAISVADRLENESEPCLIIGADTVVAFEGKILGKPSDEVVVTETEKDDAVVIELKVGPSDMGKVIGRQGRIAKAIRTVVKAASSKSSKKVIVDILQ